MAQIWPGAIVTLSTTFTVDLAPTDPTDVTLTVTDPAGAATAYAYDPGDIVRDGVGAFHADHTTTTAGLYRWRWEGTGAAAGPDEGSFYVEYSLDDYPGLCSLDDVKLTRRITSDASGEHIMRLIAGASDALREHTGRKFVPDAAASDRFYLLEPWRTTREILIDDLSATPTEAEIVDADGAGLATLTVADDLVLLPRNRESDRPITEVRLRSSAGWGYELRLKGVWGFPAVPQAVREAAIEAVVEWHKDDQALTLQSPDQFEPGTFPQRGLPQRSRDLVRPYRRIGVA